MPLKFYECGSTFRSSWMSPKPGLSWSERMKKVWSKPRITIEAVGLEVTSYLPAEIDII